MLFMSSSWANCSELYNAETGEYIQADIYGNGIVETYDYSYGTYGELEIQEQNSYGHNVEIETYNYDTGEYQYYEVD